MNLLFLGDMLADRVHPLRTLLLTSMLNLVVTPIGLIWLFTTPSPTVYYYFSQAMVLAMGPVIALAGVSGFPIEMRIFPKERFGHFCSANALVRSVGVLNGGNWRRFLWM